MPYWPFPGQEPLCAHGYTEYDAEIACSAESSNSHLPPSPPQTTPSSLLSVAYNINFNGLGGEGDPSKPPGLASITALLTSLSPDFVFLSEVSRGCTQYPNGAETLAESLNMSYAYAVEFIMLSSYDLTPTQESSYNTECTSGNAILSKYPLTDIRETRFSSNCCMYGRRAGTRSAISALATLPSSAKISLHSTHLESGNEVEFLPAVFVRANQALELATHARTHAETNAAHSSIIGGDMNGPFRALDPFHLSFQYAGYTDAHQNLPASARRTAEGTHDTGFLQTLGLQTLDYIFVHPPETIIPARTNVCHNPTYCHGFSDHTALWTATTTPNSPSQSPPTYDAAVLTYHATPGVLEGPYKSNFFSINVPLIAVFLFFHALTALRRSNKRAVSLRSATVTERELSHLPIPQHPLTLSGRFLVLAILLSLTFLLSLLLGHTRDFAVYNLFLLLLFLLPSVNKSPRLSSFLLGVGATGTCTSLLVFLAFTLPNKLAGGGTPGETSCDWVTGTVLGGLYVLQPGFVYYVVLEGRIGVQVEEDRVEVGLGSSVFLLLFLVIDETAGIGTNGNLGWSVMSASVVLSGAYWLLLFAVNSAVGWGVRKWARAGGRRRLREREEKRKDLAMIRVEGVSMS